MTDPTTTPRTISARLIAKLESGLAFLSLLCFRRPWIALGILALLTVGAAQAARQRLSLNADLAELLPSSFESVKDLETLKQRYGGIGYVGVVASHAEPDVLRRFVDDVAPRVDALASVRSVDYRKPTQFLRDHALYYLDLDDLKIVHNRLRTRFDFEVAKRNPMMLDFDDEEPPSVDLSDIEKKYEARSDQAWMRTQLDDEYYIDVEKRRIALLAKPSKMSVDLAFSRQIVGEIQQVIQQSEPTHYDPNLQVQYGGNFTKKVDQQDMIEKDLNTGTIVALVLMVAYLLLHFRRVGAVALIMIPLVMGLSWVFGFAAIVYAQLNILTGFIGAILLGLGVDHGIYLLGRFREQWQGRDAAEDAIRIAFGNTGRAVLIAAFTTAVGFAGLGMSEFRAFREFGVIAALGLLLVVVAYLTCMPALLAVAVRMGWQPRSAKAVQQSLYARLLAKRPGLLLTVFTAFLVFSMPWVSKLEFNTNFRALTAANLPSFQLDSVIDGLLGHSQTPVVVLTENREQSRFVATTLRERKAASDSSTIHLVATGDDILPDQQMEKQTIIQDMRKMIDRLASEKMGPDDRRKVDRMKRLVAAEPFDRQQLPDALGRMFFPDRKDVGDFVLVYSSVDLSDGANVSRFAKEVRGIELPQGGHASAAGEPMILADIFDLVMQEGPPVLIGTVLLIFLTMWVLMGKFWRACMALFPAMVSLVATFGLLGLLRIELNYLNIVLIPVLVGTGVDGGVHMLTRGASLDLVNAADRASVPIFGALATTALGFGTLLMAHHLGLNSLGSLAVVGLAANLFASLVGLPSLLLVVQRWRATRA